MRTCRSDLYNSSPQAGEIISCLFSHEFCCNLQDFVGNLPQFVGRFGPLWEFAVEYCCSLKTLLRYRFHMVWFKRRTSCGDRERPCLFQITRNDALLRTHRGLKSAGQSGVPFMSYRSRIIREKEKWTFSTRKLRVKQKKAWGKKKKKLKSQQMLHMLLTKELMLWPRFFPAFRKNELHPMSQLADEQILQLVGCISAFQVNGTTGSHPKQRCWIWGNRLLRWPYLQDKTVLSLKYLNRTFGFFWGERGKKGTASKVMH